VADIQHAKEASEEEDDYAMVQVLQENVIKQS
jgi:hypothetical protein